MQRDYHFLQAALQVCTSLLFLSADSTNFILPCDLLLPPYWYEGNKSRWYLGCSSWKKGHSQVEIFLSAPSAKRSHSQEEKLYVLQIFCQNKPRLTFDCHSDHVYVTPNSVYSFQFPVSDVHPSDLRNEEAENAILLSSRCW